MGRHWMLKVVGSLVLSLAACSSSTDSSTDSSSSRVSTTSVAATTTVIDTPTGSAAFCSLATDAANGHFDFTSESNVSRLTDDPSLTNQQRTLMSAAAADAVRQIATGNGYSNDALVAAVNEICGLTLTPVTMIP